VRQSIGPEMIQREREEFRYALSQARYDFPTELREGHGSLLPFRII
jgi:hypothetical protein